MAGKPALQVRGAAEFRRAITRMGASTADMTEVNQSAAQVVATEAKVIVPKLSGGLKGTIQAKARKTSGRVTAGRGRLVPYAGPIHFGWSSRNIEPQPFLYDALDHRRDEVVTTYERHVSDLVMRLERETPG